MGIQYDKGIGWFWISLTNMVFMDSKHQYVHVQTIYKFCYFACFFGKLLNNNLVGIHFSEYSKYFQFVVHCLSDKWYLNKKVAA